MNIKNIIVGILSIILAIVVFFSFIWFGIIFIILALFFGLYVRIRTFFATKKVQKDYVDIEAEYENTDDVVLVTAPDGTTEEIHLDNSSENKPR
jgi:c-di-AMP phosphodiesterase-like protein